MSFQLFGDPEVGRLCRKKKSKNVTPGSRTLSLGLQLRGQKKKWLCREQKICRNRQNEWKHSFTTSRSGKGKFEKTAMLARKGGRAVVDIAVKFEKTAMLARKGGRVVVDIAVQLRDRRKAGTT